MNINLISADYHTHTTYSHGKATVFENAVKAHEEGLKEIAITDHGFDHILFGVKRNKFLDQKQEIEFARLNTGLNVLLGVEANIKTVSGKIDIKKSEENLMDIILMGFHNFVKTDIKSAFTFLIPNILTFNAFTFKWLKNKNTKAYINAIEKNNIDIITHLNSIAKVDCYEVAKACERTNTYIELNGRRHHFTQKDIDDILKTKAMFVLNSDAHMVDNIGDVSAGIDMIEKYNIPLERIANLNGKLIKRKKHNQ